MKRLFLRSLLSLIGLAILLIVGLSMTGISYAIAPMSLTITPEPPTATAIIPTGTVVPSTATTVPMDTATVIIPTATPTDSSITAIPTGIPATPIPTDNPPTATSMPLPTATVLPTATATVLPTATATATPELIADPRVTKRIDKTTVSLGDRVRYSIEITNSGTTPATDVVVRDVLPTFLRYIQANSSRGTPQFDAGVVTLSLGTVNVGEVVTLTIDADVINFTGTTNSVRLTTTSRTDDPSNNESSVAITTQSRDADPSPTAIAQPVPRFPVTAGSWLDLPSWNVVLGFGILLGCISLGVGVLRYRTRV